MVYHIGNGKENIKYLKNEGTVKLLGCTVPSLYFRHTFIHVIGYFHFLGKLLLTFQENLCQGSIRIWV